MGKKLKKTNKNMKIKAWAQIAKKGDRIAITRGFAIYAIFSSKETAEAHDQTHDGDLEIREITINF